MSKKALNIQEDSRCKGIQGNTSKAEIKCVCLNARSIINKKNELNIMVDDIKPHIIGITTKSFFKMLFMVNCDFENQHFQSTILVGMERG